MTVHTKIIVDLIINKMKYELIYARVIVTLIIAIGLWFWVTPDAFNISPLLGAICLALPPVLGYWIIKPIFKSKKVTNATNEEK